MISVAEKAPDYGSIIYETYLRRELIKVADQVAHEAGRSDMDVSASVSWKKQNNICSIWRNDTPETGLRGFNNVLTATIAMAETAAKNDGHLSGVSTDPTDLNKLMGGMHRSDLIILAGRPQQENSARNQYGFSCSNNK